MSTIKSIATKSIATALLLSTAMATPVFAQAAISEPGAYSFYHPNGDVLHTGVPPASDALAMVPSGANASSIACVTPVITSPSAAIATAASERTLRP